MDNKKPTRGFPQVGCDDARDNCHYSPIKTRLKALIVGAACWGLLPVKLADWIICRGGMRDA